MTNDVTMTAQCPVETQSNMNTLPGLRNLRICESTVCMDQRFLVGKEIAEFTPKFYILQ